jgi:hypothetical protein
LRTIYKIIIVSVVAVLFLAGVFFSGYYYGSKTVEPGIIHKDRIVTNTIYRDRALTFDECRGELKKYDEGEFNLDLHHLGGNDYQITGQLSERKASRDVQIELARSTSWRYYLAGGIVAGAMAAYLILK